MSIKPQTILDFWFTAGPKKWFAKAADFDAAIKRRFGRFPHRNQLLGRTSTPEDITFLKHGGFKG